jgi:hypothetical protein
VSEQDFDEASPGRDYPAYGEPPRRPEIDSSWDRYIAPTLVFVIPYTLAWRITQKWLPWYLAAGIGCFVGQMVAFGFRGPRWRYSGFTKYLAFSLFGSAGVSMAAFALDALVSALFR